jgi:transposase-like protein
VRLPESFARDTELLGRRGVDVEDVARRYGVSTRTVYRWINKVIERVRIRDDEAGRPTKLPMDQIEATGKLRNLVRERKVDDLDGRVEELEARVTSLVTDIVTMKTFIRQRFGSVF